MDDKVTEAIRDMVIRTDRINKRLTVLLIIAFICFVAATCFWCSRDTKIAKLYFDQSVTQELSKDGLKQQMKGSDK